MTANGNADKSSCGTVHRATRRKDFSRYSSYPLVSGSAFGTLRRIRRTALPLPKIGVSKAVKQRLHRAKGIFGNSWLNATKNINN
jgi:hypothetical protein